jgi:hypothetical protein
MTLFNTLVATSVVALGALLQTATPVSATGLAPIGSNHAARHANGHGGMIKRKRNTHKNRKRCVQPPTIGGSNNNNGGSTDTSGSTGSTTNNGGTSTNSGGSVYIPPASNVACQGGKAGLAWGYDLPANTLPMAVTGKTCYYYNWASWKANNAPDGLHFVPMYWGPGNNHENDFTNNVINSADNFGVALAMNEYVSVLSLVI